MQKWEYCVVTGVSVRKDQFLTHYPSCYLITASGSKLVTNFQRRDRPDDVSEANAVAMLIAQLGDEGWEMVGYHEPEGLRGSFYFKRPKE